MGEASPDVATLAMSACVLFLAYFVRGVAGFGSGLIAIPLLTLLFPLTVAVPLVVTLDYLGSGAQAVKHRKFASWQDIFPLIPFTLVGVGIALLMFRLIDTSILSRSLGGFVLVFAVYQLLPVPVLRGSRVSAIPYGVLGGLLGTLFGTGGPLYVIYFKLRHLDKAAFRASFACFFIIDGSVRLVGYSVFGVFTREVAYGLLGALPVAALGLFLGGRAHLNLSETVFKRFISLVLLGSGLALIVR
ncbi:MAG: putative membrane protein YfcA [Gammaproteobacteria bacterium]|jgi:uncharacterized membrane protein YfcA